MKNTEHCLLCDLRKIDPMTGAICSLTGEKPSFNQTCIDIQFGQQFKDTLAKHHNELALLKHNKPKNTTNSLASIAIGIAVLGLDWFLTSVIFSMGWVSTLTITIMIPGLYFLFNGIGNMLKHKNKTGIAQNKLDRVNAVVAMYPINYKADTTVGTYKNGVTEAFTEIHHT